MRRYLTVLALGLSLLAAACGGDGGSSSAYCKELKRTAEEAVKGTTTSAKDLAALQASFDRALDDISDKAPSELKDDYKVLKDYIDLRFRAAIEPAKAQELATQVNALQTKYTAASKAVSDYNKKECDFDAPTTVAGSATTAATAATTTTAKK